VREGLSNDSEKSAKDRAREGGRENIAEWLENFRRVKSSDSA
jgi:hypothetical protein